MINLRMLFEDYDDEFLKCDRIRPPLNHRRDLHAFLLLGSLVPGKGTMVSGAEHDIIYLDIDLDKLAEVATEEQVIELIRCGVMFNHGCLCMFT